MTPFQKGVIQGAVAGIIFFDIVLYFVWLFLK